MKGNADRVRSPIPSLNHVGSPAKCAVAFAWPCKRLMAHLGDDASTEKCGDGHDYSIASDDQLLATAQSGDQQAFVEPCIRHSPMVKKRIFSTVKNQEDVEDALQKTLLRAYKHLALFATHADFLCGLRVSDQYGVDELA